MKSIVPYTKEIVFESKIAEICSISLEHELNFLENEIEGNFIVSGEYRSHEVSVNKEPFLYKLPFSVEVTDNIIKESIDFSITDFTYEIINQDTLKVDIEFSVTAEEQEELDRDEVTKEIEDMFQEESLEDQSEEEIDMEDKNEEQEQPEAITEEDRNYEEGKEILLNTASEQDDEFTTYHIHIVKEGDSLENICTSYQTDIETLKKYNTVDVLNIGDKIIIPSLDE